WNWGSSCNPKTTPTLLLRAVAIRFSTQWMYKVGASSAIMDVGIFPFELIRETSLLTTSAYNALFISCVIGSLASTKIEGWSGSDSFRFESSPEGTEIDSFVASRDTDIFSVPTCASD